LVEPLIPARPARAAGGTLYSETYADVYHAAAGGPGQARHVFLAGNGLPERWRNRARFVILETGFGTGLNFLSTWAAWQADPATLAPLGRSARAAYERQFTLSAALARWEALLRPVPAGPEVQLPCADSQP